MHETNSAARRIPQTNPEIIVIDLGNPKRDMLENMFQLSCAVRRTPTNARVPRYRRRRSGHSLERSGMLSS
jgi:hypothetical protein